jgi:hypothetical protein
MSFAPPYFFCGFSDRTLFSDGFGVAIAMSFLLLTDHRFANPSHPAAKQQGSPKAPGGQADEQAFLKDVQMRQKRQLAV